MSLENKPATLADVARLAGVSLGSASRALSVPQAVKPQTLQKVMKAVDQLGYVRNGAARALASRRTGAIAAIYPTLRNPMYANSVNSLQQTLASAGYQLLIASHEYSMQRETAVLRALAESSIDGVIMVGVDHEDEVFRILRQRNLPYVLTWSLDEMSYAHTVGFSNHAASYEIARHVLDQGHRRIAICGGPIAYNERARARRAGALAALHEAGIEVPPAWIVETPFSLEGGEQAIAQLWNGAEQPTALICGTDLQAIGALHACRQRGIEVPSTLSVTGFDDIDFARVSHPALTTVRVPITDIGIRTAQKIVAMIEKRPLADDPPLQTVYVARDSLGPAPRT